MEHEKNKDFSFFTYKGYPLVRNGNVIYFGNMYDDYVVMIQILQTKKIKDLEVATKVKIYQMLTDENLNPIEAIIRTSEKDGLYEALDLAVAWLNHSPSHHKSRG